jgi:hypothetical protein
MSLSILGLIGESMTRALAAAVKPFDGSFIGVQTVRIPLHPLPELTTAGASLF